MRPAIDGSHRVRLADGAEVEVEPVLEAMRRYLDAEYTPEKDADDDRACTPTSSGASRTRCRPRGAAMIFASWGACKHHHSDLMHRSFALLMALTGNQGRPGGGLRIASWWTLSGFEQMSARYEIAWWQNLMLKMAGRLPVREIERLMTERTREEPFTPLMPWLYVHAGYAETAGRDDYNDPKAGVTIDAAMKESIDKGWIPIYPPPGTDPKVFIFSAPNPLRRWPTPQIARKHLWPKLDLIVNVNFRLCTTGMHSDLLLPAAGYYEKEGIKYTQAYLPYVILGDKAVEPLGEARSEWSIFGSLARRIQERAIARGVEPAKDSFGKDVDFKTIFDQWSDGGRFDPDDFRTGMKYIFENSEMLRDTTWDEAVKRGVVPVLVNGHYSSVSAICTDQDISQPLYPHAWQVEQKEPWPTLTGRQQFYIDHDWYLRAGEAFPVHKDPPAAGGNYPLKLTGGHTRWSIHAIWRDSELMLRLQRGEPVVYLNALDARERAIADNDRVRVYNDVGAFQALRQAERERAARPSDHLPRLGAVSASRSTRPAGAGRRAVEGAASRRRLWPATLSRRLRRTRVTPRAARRSRWSGHDEPVAMRASAGGASSRPPRPEAIALGLLRLTVLAPTPEGAAADGSGGTREYGDWRDVYVGRWRWDRVAHGTHTNANCVSACSWNLYVRDDVVWREEQLGAYDPGVAGCPDFNPRGCQKGACASDLFTRPQRLRYPLVRVGARGEGRFKRVSWDEALDRIAEAMVTALAKQGGSGLLLEAGPEMDYGPHTAAPLRLFKLLGAPITDAMAMIGDVAFGGTITLGTPHVGGSSDDWFRSKLIVLWAFNPVSTRIPDAHFLTEARYGGAKVINIAPDYSPSTVHADGWLNPRAGTDAALALAAVQVIVAENLHDEAYIRSQTDLPLLVRSDDGRFLRGADVRRGGGEEGFYAWDPRAGAIAEAPGARGASATTLDWGGIEPALRGRFRVRLADGHEVEVRPVFDLLVERLNADSTPEQAAAITGVSAESIRRFARDFAGAEAALILSQYGACKFYHSDLLQRAQILLASVTGNIGKAGGGWHSASFVGMEGMAVLAMQRELGIKDLVMLAVRSYFRDAEENLADFSRYFVPSGLWHYVHGGLDSTSAVPAYGDPMLPEGPGAYVDEALAKGWYPVRRGAAPAVVVNIFGNVLRHSRRGRRLREYLWPKIDTVVTVDFRMSETALHSDVVLPAAGWYEKVGFKYIPAYIPYVTLGDRAVPPAAESKPEWEICHLLATRVAGKARSRGGLTYRDYLDVERSLDDLDEAFSDGGRFGPHDEEKLADFVLSVSQASKGTDLATLREHGHVRIASVGTQGGTTGIYSDYSPTEPIVPMRWFVEKKQPYPTAHRAPAVLHRPSLVSRARRSVAAVQSPAGGRRGLSAHALRRAHTLEHPRHVARPRPDVAPTARRARRADRRGRRSDARHR